MNFFISDAMAAGAEQPSAWTGLWLPMVILFVVFYFLLIRPQQKKAKEHANMVNEVSKGDEVVTTGGLLGKIKKVGENFVQLELSESMVVTVQKPQIAQLMPKGTLKSSS